MYTVIVPYIANVSFFSQAHKEYIQYLMQYMEIHSTVSNSSTLPAGVHHHGVVSHTRYKDLLHKAKVIALTWHHETALGVCYCVPF